VDVLLLLTFLARRYGLGATSAYRFKIGDFAPMGRVNPKIQVEWIAPPNILLRKLG